jgi:hypothetical protein
LKGSLYIIYGNILYCNKTICCRSRVDDAERIEGEDKFTISEKSAKDFEDAFEIYCATVTIS